MAAAIAALLVLVVVIVGIALAVIKANKSSASNGAAEPERAQPEAVPAPARRGGLDRMRGARLRNRRAAAVVQAAPDTDSASDAEESEEEAGGRMTKREARKQAEREAREAERAAREARAGKVNLYEERRRQKELEREERERQEEEQRQRAEEERQRRQDEEASKWMGLISLEQQGEEQAEAEQAQQGLLEAFVAYITQRKMVPLDELALEFKLRTSDVIDRIQGLEAMGRLSGVMDERGKYIYISREEMQAVAAFIKGRGRVAIAELAAKSSSLIDLDAKAASAATAVPVLHFDDVLGPEAAAA